MRKKIEYDEEELNKLLGSIFFTKESWIKRKEYTRTEFLELLYKRIKKLMQSSNDNAMKMAFHGQAIRKLTNSLDEWLNDELVDDGECIKFRTCLKALFSNYYNIELITDLRQRVKTHQPDEAVYLTYPPPGSLKESTESVYVILSTYATRK